MAVFRAWLIGFGGLTDKHMMHMLHIQARARLSGHSLPWLERKLADPNANWGRTSTHSSGFDRSLRACIESIGHIRLFAIAPTGA